MMVLSVGYCCYMRLDRRLVDIQGGNFLVKVMQEMIRCQLSSEWN
jgi:hypothetical protein